MFVLEFGDLVRLLHCCCAFVLEIGVCLGVWCLSWSLEFGQLELLLFGVVIVCVCVEVIKCAFGVGGAVEVL